MLLLLLGLGRYIEPIPLAALAGVLMKVGWDIIDWPLLTRIHRIRREHLVIMLITLGFTVFVDLVTVVGVGLIVAGMTHARRLEKLEVDNVISVPLQDQAFFSEEEDITDPYMARVGLVVLKGIFTVASSHKLFAVIGGDIKDHEVVIFDFSDVMYIDDSAAMLISRLIDIASKEQTEFIMMGLVESSATTLQELDILRRVPESHIVKTMDAARKIAKRILGR